MLKAGTGLLFFSMSYKQLLDNQRYEHKVCGMHKNLAQEIRDTHKQGGERENVVFSAINGRICNKLASVGIVISDW